MKNKTYKLTEAIKKNAIRALALSKKLQRENEHVVVAKSIIVNELQLDDVKKMYAYLVKSKFDSKKVESDGGPTNDYLSTLMHGGSAGLAWCRSILREENILKSYKKKITEDSLNKEDKISLDALPIQKSQNEDLKQATYVVLVPDCVDEHGDTYNEDEVRKACHNFNRSSAKANLFHLIETNGFDIAESYIAPNDLIIGDTVITKGTWLATLQFNDESLWEGVKSGEFSGVSIGAMARVENLE